MTAAARSSPDRVWFITGASSGFGRLMAEAALSRGERVFATARNPASLQYLAGRPRAAAAQLDVTDMAQICAAIAAAAETFGRIDAVINSAGYARIGALEETTDQDSRHQFEVNVFGPMNVIRAVLPLMRRQGGGFIVNFSSLGGLIATAGVSNYCASKFAIEGMSEALAEEVAPFGVKVMLVEPGAFKTGFVGGLKTSPAMEEYRPAMGAMRDWLGSHPEGVGADPAPAPAAIMRALDSESPPLRLLIGVEAIAGARLKLDRLRREFDAWESVSRLEPT